MRREGRQAHLPKFTPRHLLRSLLVLDGALFNPCLLGYLFHRVTFPPFFSSRSCCICTSTWFFSTTLALRMARSFSRHAWSTSCSCSVIWASLRATLARWFINSYVRRTCERCSSSALNCMKARRSAQRVSSFGFMSSASTPAMFFFLSRPCVL